MERRFRKAGIEARRWQAAPVSGETPTNPDIGHRGIYAYSCYLSHIQILHTASLLSFPFVAVFEDDCLLSFNFKEKWNAVHSQLAGLDWDIFYWYVWSERRGQRISEDIVVVPNGTMLTHAYMINGKSIAKALSLLVKEEECSKPYFVPMDIALERQCQKGLLKAFGHPQNLALQEVGWSDIGQAICDHSKK